MHSRQGRCWACLSMAEDVAVKSSGEPFWVGSGSDKRRPLWEMMLKVVRQGSCWWRPLPHKADITLPDGVRHYVV